jgi:predicted porin
VIILLLFCYIVTEITDSRYCGALTARAVRKNIGLDGQGGSPRINAHQVPRQTKKIEWPASGPIEHMTALAHAGFRTAKVIPASDPAPDRTLLTRSPRGPDPMKKILLGSTALVAAAAFAAPASAAEKIKLGLGGYYQTAFVLIDEDVANTRTDSLKQEGEVYFTGETTLDTGITVGVMVQLEAYTTDDQVDEHYVYFDGGFGRVQLGAADSAAYLMHYSAPTAIAGHGVDSPNFFHATPPGTHGIASNYTFLNTTSDANKLTYFTPRFAGFQLGLSYTPSLAGGLGGSSGSYGNLPDNTVGAQEKIVEIGANYVNSFGGIDVAISAGYLTGSLEQDAAGFDDQEVFTLGTQIGFAGFTFGGGYQKNNLGVALDEDLEQWNVGLTYGFGPFTVGAGYGYGSQTYVGGVEDELSTIEVGGTYEMGPGISLMAGYFNYEFDSTIPANRNTSDAFMIGTSFDF